MALRDPGAPRRNPLFAVDERGPNPDAPDPDAPEADAGARGDASWADGPWVDGRDDPLLGDPSLDDAFGDASFRDPLLGAPGSVVGPWLSALQDAGPEAAEHLVNAAHELTLAVKVVVDAVERSLAEQRVTFLAEREAAFTGPDAAAPGTTETHEPRSGAGATAPRVRRIDVE
jgi:hypothetical protein